AELVALLCAELGDLRKEPKLQILGADIGQEIPVQRHVFRPHQTDQHVLAAPRRLVQFAPANIAFVWHQRVPSHLVSVRSGQDHPGRAPENFTTFAHFSVSSTMSLPSVAGVNGSGTLLMSAIRALILGSARPASISPLSLSTISAGVPFGRADGEPPADLVARYELAHRRQLPLPLRPRGPRHRQ